MSFKNHLESHESLVTPYEETRAGFISMALEKNREATPFIEEAKVLKTFAIKAKKAKDLLSIHEIQSSLLTAAGVSDKARKHMEESDKNEAILGLMKNFIEPSGNDFVDELVYRFLLTRGDSLGGRMRNFAGTLGEWRFTRILISTFSVQGIICKYLDLKSKKWVEFHNASDIEKQVRGWSWEFDKKKRTLIYNLTVPTVGKNVDLCLFDCSPDEILPGTNKDSAHHKPEKYLALGELKGGIDPAGADEHWKTAKSALDRIREAFADKCYSPHTFFIGAAIESAMAQEIYQQLIDRVLSNGANLTNERQVVSLCDWLIQI